MPELEKTAVRICTRLEDTTFKVAVTAKEVERISKISWLEQFKFLPIACTEEDIFVTTIDGEVEMTAMPVHLIAFVSFSAQSQKQLSKIKNLWSHKYGSDAPRIINMDSLSGQDKALNEFLEVLLQALLETSKRNTKLMKELVVLRASNEEMQEAFSRLETYVDSTSSLTHQLALSLEPKLQYAKLDLTLGRTIEQRLPTSSEGISEVAIHVGTFVGTIDGLLDVQLDSLEDGITVGKWSVPSDQIRKMKWLKFSLDKALSVDKRSLVIRAKWQGTGCLQLSLSSAHPDDRWCAIQEKRSLGRTLAIRAFRSIPGTRPARSADSIGNEKARTGNWLVASDVLKNVKTVSAPPDHVLFLEDKNSILVHPVMESLTVACLPSACPSGATHIWAEVETAHPEAATIEYALAVNVPNESGRIIDFENIPDDQISEWISVAPLTHSEVHLFLPKPISGRGDIYLITRIPAGSSSSYGWAHFSKVRAAI